MSVTEPKIIISPSILSADFGRLAEEIADVERAGCDWIHVDVMDGHFVPNLTIGPPVIRKLRKTTKLPFDVHLMIEEPLPFIQAYRDSGADYITVHVEACRDVEKTLAAISKSGAKAGLTLRPKTSINEIESFLGMLELVLVMTVDPGFSGQAFMPDAIKKVTWLRQKFSKHVSVDGGINLETSRLAAQEGANVFVSGSAIFKQADRKSFIDRLRQSASLLT